MNSKTRTTRNDEAGDVLQQQAAKQVRGSSTSWPAHDLNPLMGGALLKQSQVVQTA